MKFNRKNKNRIQFKEEEVLILSDINPSENKELNIVRTFNAPKNLLYQAFTNPDYLGRWWGNYYCERSVCQLDPQVGGVVNIKMIMRGGKEVLLKGEYHELIENERIVFTTGPVDKNTNESELVTLNTVLLEEIDGKTKLNLNVKFIKAPEGVAEFAVQGMFKGWPDSLKKLEEFIETGYSNVST